MDNINDFCILIPEEDKDDLFGDYYCVTNPEGYDFREGHCYSPYGEGSMYWENNEWNVGVGLVRDDYTHVYNLRGYIWDPVTMNRQEENHMIPADIMIRHFSSIFYYPDETEFEEFMDDIKTIRRDRRITQVQKDDESK